MQQAIYDSTPTAPAEENLLALLKRLARDAVDLLQNEFALARAEGRETLIALRHTITFMIIAATLMLGGGLAVIAGLVLLLAIWIPAWVSALAVGALLSGVGAAIFLRAAKQASARDFDLPRTRASLSNDLDLLKRDGKPT